MLASHRRRQTWAEMVDRYIVATEFVRGKLVEGDLPSEKIMDYLLGELVGKWKRLSAQYGFRRAPVRTVNRLLSWLVRCLSQRAVIVRLPRWKLKVLLPAKWKGIGRYVFAFREFYEPELAYLQNLLFPRGTFVDVGANLGIYTLVASRIVGNLGCVIAFEPSMQSFPLLRKNVALNGLTNICAFRAALSERAEKVRLYHAPCCPSGNSLAHHPSFPESFEEVVTETLDAVLQRISAERVDVIKIDVQGAEELVLRGAQKVVASTNPVIIFEFWPEGASLLGLSPYGAWNLLEGLGYRFFTVRSDCTISRIESPPTDMAYVNILAIHPDKRKGFLQ